MRKSKLEGFIKKYNLGGNVNSVKWKSSSNILSTSFVTPDKSLLGNVKVHKFQFDDIECGVYRTDQLLKYLGPLDDDISLNVSKVGDTPVSLKLTDASMFFDFMFSRLDVIPSTPDMKQIPNFETKIKLGSVFIDKFIRSKTSLSEADTFTILNKDDSLQVVIGYSSTNTDRASIPVEFETNNLDNKISFNANLFKEVLIANKDCTSVVLEVSNQGLARVNFKIDDYVATYYIVATSEV